MVRSFHVIVIQNLRSLRTLTVTKDRRIRMFLPRRRKGAKFGKEVFFLKPLRLCAFARDTPIPKFSSFATFASFAVK
jgi:hypothetical protein